MPRTKGMSGHQRAYRGRSDDWITPKEIIDAMGPFDLDPCACNPQPWPTATRMIHLPEDGLAANWHGRVWLNPPYGPDAAAWLEKLSMYGCGTALIFARTETEAFHRFVWEGADAVLFLEGRLHFHTPDGQRAKQNAGAPSVLVAYGLEDADILFDRYSVSELRGKFLRLE